MLILAFDTATDVATSALVSDGQVLGERASVARTVLEDAHRLVEDARARVPDLDALVVGTGPGSFTSTRIGLAAARGLSLALGLPVAGVSTLDALAAGMPGALPVIDGRRGEIFSTVNGTPRCLRPEELALREGTTLVGDGAVRHRGVLERAGALVPADDDPAHVPWARFHAALARDFGPAEHAEPIYLRLPDAERALAAAGEHPA